MLDFVLFFALIIINDVLANYQLVFVLFLLINYIEIWSYMSFSEKEEEEEVISTLF